MTAPTLLTVYVIGDSISLHYSEHLRLLLDPSVRLLRRRDEESAYANLDVPQGANAGDSTMMLALLRARLDAGGFSPNLLLLNCGLHDIKRPGPDSPCAVSVEQYSENLLATTALLAAHRIPTAWVRITPCSDITHNTRHSPGFFRFARDVDAYNRVADAVMAKADIPRIDLHGFTERLDPPEENFCDHIHFKPEVRRLQAAHLAGWIAAFFTPAASLPA
jgi:lysophospholipase L1-like esterase